MITVKCTYSNGDEIVTRINGTLETAKEYFEGSLFNIGSVQDIMAVCIKVELVEGE